MAALREDVFLRRRNHAAGWFAEHLSLVDAATPGDRNTPALLGYLAQWMDMSDSLTETIQRQIAKYTLSLQNGLLIVDYLQIRLALGIQTQHPEDFDLAIALSTALSAHDMLALAHFSKAQAVRKTGDLDKAISHAAQARKLALHIGAEPLAGVAEALEGILNLDRGRLARALELLREAEAILRETEDWLWYGRIQAGLGAVAIEEGRYEEALDFLRRAAGLFENNAAPGADLARVYAALAQAQSRAAARIAARVDAAAQHRRRLASRGIDREADLAARSRVEQLRAEALALLAQSRSLFQRLGEAREDALASVDCGFLNLDCGDLERASRRAAEAFDAGSRQNDALVMAQASLLHSRAESAWFEEGIGLDIARHALRAREHASTAVGLASRLSASGSLERRTLANAYVTQGLVFANEFFNDIEAARECCHRANEYLDASHHDHLWDEYRMLAAKVLRCGGVDEKLRRWTQGVVESSTFQQMTEEFAELVIPRVWAREGRNVSKVVAKLSISPKKVRRILSRAGLKA